MVLKLGDVADARVAKFAFHFADYLHVLGKLLVLVDKSFYCHFFVGFIGLTCILSTSFNY